MAARGDAIHKSLQNLIPQRCHGKGRVPAIPLSTASRSGLVTYLRAQKAFQDLAAHSKGAKVLQDLQGIYTRLQQVALADGDAAQATEADRSAIEIAKKLNLADS
jgi:hypothetical protein